MKKVCFTCRGVNDKVHVQVKLAFYHFFSEGEEDEYIAEDRETDVVRTRKTAQRVQTTILQDLHQTLGVEATLPETAIKDLILQVIHLRVYPFF